MLQQQQMLQEKMLQEKMLQQQQMLQQKMLNDLAAADRAGSTILTPQPSVTVRDGNGQPIVINDGYTCDGVNGNIIYADPAMVKLWIPTTKEQRLFAPQVCKHR